MDDTSMMAFWEIVFIVWGIVGLLASAFNWEWYFGLTKARRWERMIGRNAYRIINAIVCLFFIGGAISLLISDLGAK